MLYIDGTAGGAQCVCAMTIGHVCVRRRHGVSVSANIDAIL